MKILRILGLAIFFFVLAFPSIQGGVRYFEEPELGGYVPKMNPPEVTFDNFMSGNLQSYTELYAKRKYGFRAWLVRLYNQWQFSFYRKLGMAHVVIGKDDVLITQGYIKASYGETFVGEDSILNQVNRMVYLRERLNEEGKEMLMVLPSSKGTFFKERIPEEYWNTSDTTNYWFYKKELIKNNFPLIDFNSYFLEIKDSAKYPLYPKYGIHWTYYGGYLAVDSILNYIEYTTGKDLPDLVVEKIEEKEAYDGDIDILLGLNLIKYPEMEICGYPKLRYEKEGKDSLKVLLVSDSFAYALTHTKFLKEAFCDSEFWFYNNGRHKEEAYTEEKDLREFWNRIRKFDHIILLSNEGTMHSFAWRFLTDACNAGKLTEGETIQTKNLN